MPVFNNADIHVWFDTSTSGFSNIASGESIKESFRKIYNQMSRSNNAYTVVTDLMNTGNKNVLDLTGAKSYYENGVYFKVNSDLSITMSGTATSAAFFSVPVTIAPGDYIITGMTEAGGSDSYRLELRLTPKGATTKVCDSTSGTLWQRTGSNYEGYFNIRVGSGYAFSTPKTVYPMICDVKKYALSTAYEPYCPPLSSLYYTEKTVSETVSSTTSKGECNLFNYKTIIPSIFLSSSDGLEQPNLNYDASEFIPASANTYYTINELSYSGTVSHRIYYYNSSKTFISRTVSRISDNPNGFTFKTPSSCAYIRLNFETEANTSGTQDPSTLVFVKGNTAILKYMPYESAVDFVARSDAQTGIDLVASSSIAMFETVGCCGDSFTAGYLYNKTGTQYYDPNYVPDGTYPKISYPTIMGRLYGVTVTTFAKGGLTSGDFRTDPAGLPALLADTAKDLYIIALGLNDKTQNVPIGTESDIDTEPSTPTALGNFGAIIRAIQTHAPNCKIILSKSLWVCDEGTTSLNSYYTYISTIVETLHTHLGLPFIETANDPYFCSSQYINGLKGLHPTAPLYAGIGRRMGELVGKCMLDNPQYFFDYYRT